MWMFVYVRHGVNVTVATASVIGQRTAQNLLKRYNTINYQNPVWFLVPIQV